MIFDPTGTQTLIYSGDLSVPQGDPEDWIAFQSDGPSVFISLECKGNGSLKADLTVDALPTNLNIACGDLLKETPVKVGLNYVVHLQAIPTSGDLQYINYVLTIRGRP